MIGADDGSLIEDLSSKDTRAEDTGDGDGGNGATSLVRATLRTA